MNCVGNVVIICLITVLCSVSASDLGWGRSVQTIPSAYYSVATPNVLRCGKLCERQGKCAAVTFDVRERKCYMHDSQINANQTERGSNGRYLIKNYGAGSKPDTSGNTCDEGTQINIPTMHHKYGGCHNITEINECESSPCRNNATCEDKENDYHCNCQAGYTGKNCSVDINECEPSPCQNNATCEDKDNGYHCNCQTGYTGKNCSVDINECESSPCQNNATCEDKKNDYRCNCQAGYTGKNCSVELRKKCPGTKGYQLWFYPDMTLCLKYGLVMVHGYDDAKAKCSVDGGHLLLIDSESMRLNMNVTAATLGAPYTDYIFIDGVDKLHNDTFVNWEDKQMTWFEWVPGEPDGGEKDCLRTRRSDSFLMKDGRCDKTHEYFICQIDV